MQGRKRTFYEFFAGGGMARAGLGAGWTCLFANDFDPMKCVTYRDNWGDADLVQGDVAEVSVGQLPGQADLAWASFPCQDLSLAGGYKGLGRAGDNQKTRSGTFWLFFEKMAALKKEGRAPQSIVLENVYGTLTSHGGADFVEIIRSIASLGYKLGAMVIDAKRFVPQSRPRFFVVAVRSEISINAGLIAGQPCKTWHPKALVAAHDLLPANVKKSWLWWKLPDPPPRAATLSELIEDRPTGVSWNSPEVTRHIVGMMSDVNVAKLTDAQLAGRRVVGGIYRRTRPDENGIKRQRAEVRFDNTAGCLRTPAGGSSRQSIIVVDGDRIRTRLLSPREAARLMGLPEHYKLPPRYNDAYHVCGDGVVVPVVRYIAQQLLEPVLDAGTTRPTLAAAE
ncbi:DNA (cytosine-5-)-methyltransferase [Alsobacter metallidurans]|uniref:DNA (cytosine-5-)-methyltransferase n=2 Tax=Alsobacter metallidurans TaxID=340221 RepID=A0A917MHR3_9HYPH|nr:DNA (cytosine-5-)-methyltransferase [Alsobacter metallidurans]